MYSAAGRGLEGEDATKGAVASIQAGSEDVAGRKTKDTILEQEISGNYIELQAKKSTS